MEENVVKRWRIKASYTIEAGIVGVFLISFLGMGISYELHYMDHILEKIQKERITKEHWNMSKEVEQYLKYREIKDLVDEVIGG